MKKNILLTLLFAIAATQTVLPAESDQSPKGLSRVCKSYATSLISGGLIGSITGTLSIHAIAKSFNTANYLIGKNDGGACLFGTIVPIIILIAENRLRTTLTSDISQNLDENAINHNKNLLRDTAWISSWIAFLSLIKITS